MEALLACLGGEATEPARRCVAALLRGHVETALAVLAGVPPSAVASVLLAQWGLVHLVGGCLLVRGAGDVGKALAAHRTPLARRIAAWQGAVLACAALHAFAAAALSAFERPEAALAAAPALWVDVLTAFLVAPATAGRLARSLLLAGGCGVAGAAGGAVVETAARAAAAVAALAALVAYARGGAPPDERAYLPDEREDLPDAPRAAAVERVDAATPPAPPAPPVDDDDDDELAYSPPSSPARLPPPSDDASDDELAYAPAAKEETVEAEAAATDEAPEEATPEEATPEEAAPEEATPEEATPEEAPVEVPEEAPVADEDAAAADEAVAAAADDEVPAEEAGGAGEVAVTTDDAEAGDVGADEEPAEDAAASEEPAAPGDNAPTADAGSDRGFERGSSLDDARSATPPGRVRDRASRWGGQVRSAAAPRGAAAPPPPSPPPVAASLSPRVPSSPAPPPRLRVIGAGALLRAGVDMKSQKVVELKPGAVVVPLEAGTSASGVPRTRVRCVDGGFEGWLSNKTVEESPPHATPVHDATPRPLARGPRKSSGGRSSPASSVASSQGRASPLDFDAAPRARPFRRYGSPVDLVPEGADAAAALARPCVGAEPVPEPLARGKDASPVDFGVAVVAPVASRDASAPPPSWPETVGCGFDGVARSLR